MLGEKAIDCLVDLAGRDSRFDQRAGNLMGTPDHEAGPPHQGNFTSGTKINHASRTHASGQ